MIIVISPTWEVRGDVYVDLSGISGVRGKEGRNRDDFHQMLRYGVTSEDGHFYGKDGRNGRAGGPGSPGGHFLGLTDEIINAEKLTIFSNGGDGGKGGNGGNGKNTSNKIFSSLGNEEYLYSETCKVLHYKYEMLKFLKKCTHVHFL